MPGQKGCRKPIALEAHHLQQRAADGFDHVETHHYQAAVLSLCFKLVCPGQWLAGAAHNQSVDPTGPGLQAVNQVDTALLAACRSAVLLMLSGTVLLSAIDDW